jgi:Pyridoxamine 5'-phosphate oxidase
VYYPATGPESELPWYFLQGGTMAQQGSLELLHDPVAEKLLAAAIPARLAYKWLDGTPRVVPVWFHWTGEQVIVASPGRAPKLKALRVNPDVALTIDEYAGWPYRALMIRGTAAVEMLDDVVPEYALAADRYFGPEQGPAWISTLRGKPMGRIPITPTWVGILDFETRFPSALTA